MLIYLKPDKEQISNFFSHFFKNYYPRNVISFTENEYKEVMLLNRIEEFSLGYVKNFDELRNLFLIISEINAPKLSILQKRIYFHEFTKTFFSSKTEGNNSEFLNEILLLKYQSYLTFSSLFNSLQINISNESINESIKLLKDRNTIKIEAIPKDLILKFQTIFPFVKTFSDFIFIVEEKIIIPFSIMLFFFKPNPSKSPKRIWDKALKIISIFVTKCILNENHTDLIKLYTQSLNSAVIFSEIQYFIPQIRKEFSDSVSWINYLQQNLDFRLESNEEMPNNLEEALFKILIDALFESSINGNQLISTNLRNKLLQINNDVIHFQQKFVFIKNRFRNQITNYSFSGNIVEDNSTLNEIFENFGELNSLVTNLEESRGIERYLNEIFVPEFRLLYEKIMDFVQEFSNIISTKIKCDYFNNWSLFRIKSILFKILDQGVNLPNELGNLITTQVQANNVIIFILDGFGSVQLNWYLRCLQNSNLFTENIFNKFAKNPDTIKMNLISTFVPHTIPGLCSIFFGLKPNETGIFSKNFLNPSGYGSASFSLNEPFQCNKVDIADLSSKSIFHSLFNINSLFLNLKHNEETQDVLGNFFYHNPDNYREERQFFLKLAENLKKFQESKKNLFVVYYKYIDTKGHPIGPFSLFEKRELEKLNLSLINFFLYFKKNYKALYQDTTIILTSDHGFVETYSQVGIDPKKIDRKKVILKKDLINVFKNDFFLVQNNRSIFLRRTNFSGDIDDIFKIFHKVWGFEKNEILILRTRDYPTLFGKNKVLNKVGDFFITFLNNSQIVDKFFIDENLSFKGQHGGWRIEELFVPCWIIPLKNLDLK